MANHLIIGLGGTGGRVLKEMRKRVFQEFHTNDPDKGTYVNYLYVDSSEEDLRKAERWQVMGNHVGLARTQRANTHGTVTLQTLQEIHRNEVLNAIITEDEAKRTLEDGDIRDIIVKGIGGQRRRFGRLLIANSLQTMAQDGFLSKIKEAAKDLQTKGNKETDVTFHICAGLAGGTGSGSILDVVSQIRTLYTPTQNTKYNIYLYLYIPENGEPAWEGEKGYYHANGYTALEELNALSVGALEPVDITGARDPKTGRIRRLTFSSDVFNAAFLYSNSNGKRTAGEELNRIVADFIYQIIFKTGVDEVSRILTAENAGMGAEDKVRSRHFLSLGLSRLEYPEYEIKDYMAYNFAEQALSQFLYNEWLDGQGFTHVEKTKACAAYEADLRDLNKRESLGLANKILTLESPIIPRNGDEKWRDIRTEWRTRCDNFNKAARRLIPAQWTGEFLQIAETYFREGYRGLGVRKFYEAETNNLDVYAKFLCGQIESKLFDEWCDGKKGIIEVRTFLDILIRVLQDYVPDLEQKVEEARKKAKLYEDRRDHERTVIVNKMGGILYIHRDKDFDDFCNNSCEYYIHATQEEGWKYAVSLLDKVISKLQGKLDELEQEFYTPLNLILNFEGDENKSNMGVIMAIREKLKEDQLDDGEVTKLYDPKKIKEIRTEFIHDKKLQAQVAEQVRTQIILALGDSYEHSFSAFSSADLDQEKLKDLILNVCFDEAEKTLNEYKSQKILGIDICEKLVKENPGRYEGIIRDLIEKTSPYIEENSTELSAGSNDKLKGYQYIVYIPKGKDTRSYDKIVEVVKGAAASVVIAENNKSNQIVVQAIHHAFPLRILLNLKKMREQYEQLMISKEKGDLNRIVLYSQPYDRPLPQLYKRTRQELVETLTKPILLGYAMGLFEKSEDEDGVTFDAINISSTSRSDKKRGGKGLFDTIEVLARDEEDAESVMKFIEEVLKNNFRHNAKKAELAEKIESIYKTVIAPQFNEWSDDARKWKEIIEKLFDNELQQK